MNEVGRLLIIFGVIMVIVGIVSQFVPFFRLPGDIYIKRDGFSFYFPIVTSIILSIVLSFIINIFLRK